MTIVVAYIPSPLGDAALERGITEARAHGGDLVVVNVARGEALVEQRRLYDEEASALAARLDEAGVAYRLRREVQPGVPPYEQILDVAQDVDAQMIVIGIARRSPTGKLLFGSNAQRILLEAPCPVLAVKAAPEGRRR